MAKSIIWTTNDLMVTNIEQAKPILLDINWNFSNPFSIGRSGMQLFDCRKHHWFPATFIPEIPYTLIEVLTKPGAIVYDPFAGIGTTVFQSLLLGRKPYATEIGLVPVEVIKSFLILLNPKTNIPEITRALSTLNNDYNSNIDYTEMLNQSHVKVELLKPWFSKQTFNQLMYIAFCELGIHNPYIKAAFRVSLSATLKAVCSQDRGWGCIADNMHPKPAQLEKEKNALDHFNRKVNVLTNDLSKVRKELSEQVEEFLFSTESNSIINQCDVRHCNLPNDSVDLVVTSPPYPDMADYSTSQRLSYYWLGADPMKDLTFEIGARRKRSKPSSVKDYIEEMKEAINVISTKIKPGGYACFVMPRFNTDNVNNSVRKKAIQDCLSTLSKNFILELELSRILPTRRRHHNQKWASLEQESIYIYRRIP